MGKDRWFLWIAMACFVVVAAWTIAEGRWLLGLVVFAFAAVRLAIIMFRESGEV